ncbi:hypothetical protein J6590_083861 [Homalodisca vitripennis]|nr:hypothetical protein J6590_083861 [Homalodisca vitripennis]
MWSSHPTTHEYTPITKRILFWVHEAGPGRRPRAGIAIARRITTNKLRRTQGHPSTTVIATLSTILPHQPTRTAVVQLQGYLLLDIWDNPEAEDGTNKLRRTQGHPSTTVIATLSTILPHQPTRTAVVQLQGYLLLDIWDNPEAEDGTNKLRRTQGHPSTTVIATLSTILPHQPTRTAVVQLQDYLLLDIWDNPEAEDGTNKLCRTQVVQLQGYLLLDIWDNPEAEDGTNKLCRTQGHPSTTVIATLSTILPHQPTRTAVVQLQDYLLLDIWDNPEAEDGTNKLCRGSTTVIATLSTILPHQPTRTAVVQLQDYLLLDIWDNPEAEDGTNKLRRTQVVQLQDYLLLDIWDNPEAEDGTNKLCRTQGHPSTTVIATLSTILPHQPTRTAVVQLQDYLLLDIWDNPEAEDGTNKSSYSRSC